ATTPTSPRSTRRLVSAVIAEIDGTPLRASSIVPARRSPSTWVCGSAAAKLRLALCLRELLAQPLELRLQLLVLGRDLFLRPLVGLLLVVLRPELLLQVLAGHLRDLE